MISTKEDRELIQMLKRRQYYLRNKEKLKAKYKKKITHDILRDENIRRRIRVEKKKIDSGEHGSFMKDKVEELIERYKIAV